MAPVPNVQPAPAWSRATALSDFWFDGADDRADIRPGHACYTRWFGGTQAVDDRVRRHFADDLRAARAGACSPGPSAHERLAWVLLLDQVPRHVHRGRAAAFASDAPALAAARQCLDLGLDRRLRPVEQVFLLLPLQHAERLADHAGAIDRLQALLQQVRHDRLPIGGFVAAALQAEREHQAELARFGRYPRPQRRARPCQHAGRDRVLGGA